MQSTVVISSAAIFLLIVSIAMCGSVFSHCDKIDLKKNDLGRLSVYDNVNYLVFRSANGLTDTIRVVENKKYYSPCNKVALSEYQFQTQEISFENSGNHGEFYDKVLFILTNKYKEDAVADLYLHVHNVVKEYGEYIHTDTIENPYLSRTFPSRVYSGSSSGASSGNEIASFHWNGQSGLVRYITREGAVFDLFKTVTRSDNEQ